MKNIIALVLFLMLPVITTGQQIKCGTERWSVKTLSDADTSLVRFDSVEETTVSALVNIPATYPEEDVRTDLEKRVVHVQAVIFSFKEENDRDIHLAIKDPATGETMIAEIPDPACPSVPKRWKPIFKKLRLWVTANLGRPTAKFRNVKKLVDITSPLLLDKLHGQRGCAPNGIECHPVIALTLAHEGS